MADANAKVHAADEGKDDVGGHWPPLPLTGSKKHGLSDPYALVERMAELGQEKSPVSESSAPASSSKDVANPSGANDHEHQIWGAQTAPNAGPVFLSVDGNAEPSRGPLDDPSKNPAPGFGVAGAGTNVDQGSK